VTGRRSAPPIAARGRLAAVVSIMLSPYRFLGAFARWLAAVLCLAGIGATGCTSFDLVNALTPDDGYAVQRDLRYGAGARRTLDLYIPDNATGDSPVVVFFYGGEWSSGAKADYAFVGEAFASRGFVTAIPPVSMQYEYFHFTSPSPEDYPSSCLDTATGERRRRRAVSCVACT